MEEVDARSTTRCNRNICLPFSQDVYNKNIEDPINFRKCINERIELFPELFPPEIYTGYQMKDSYCSKKQLIMTRRIEIAGIPYTIRPSFIMPYMTGLTDEIEKALFLRKFSVPFWALSHIFGKDPMYWYRIEQALGRNSIVGTTVRKPDDIPNHLAADEKHTRILGNKVYVATTVGNECILGASIAEDAGEEALTGAYKVFKDESQCLKPTYTPTTVNIDGWKATHNAWSFLFTSVVVICCFLHVYIKFRDRGKKKYKDLFFQVSSKLWDCYHAKNKAAFSQRIRRLVEWCNNKKVPDIFVKPIEKLRKNIAVYMTAYDHPKAHRTSNMLDRLMQRMDRHLFNAQYFHGSTDAAKLSIRGWALIQNFAPSNPRTVRKHNGFQSPAERLNSFRYHDNWLHNLMISASLGGYRTPPQNPI
jgi:hypothetical protein